MPKIATVAADLRCPRCGGPLLAWPAVDFQWGYCPAAPGGSIVHYRVGDPVRWRADRNGRVPAWTYFRDGCANIGHPAYGDVLVREFHGRCHCDRCRGTFGGIGVVVRGGVIREVRVFDDLPACATAVSNPDGRLIERPDWDDHPMTGSADGGEGEQLVPQPELLGRAGPGTTAGRPPTLFVVEGREGNRQWVAGVFADRADVDEYLPGLPDPDWFSVVTLVSLDYPLYICEDFTGFRYLAEAGAAAIVARLAAGTRQPDEWWCYTNLYRVTADWRPRSPGVDVMGLLPHWHVTNSTLDQVARYGLRSLWEPPKEPEEADESEE